MGERDTWDFRFPEGERAQIWARTIAAGAKVEHKRDYKAHETGNLFIEHYQLKHGSDLWTPSGLTATQADWWCFTIGPEDDKRMIWLTVQTLRRHSDRAYRDKGLFMISGGDKRIVKHEGGVDGPDDEEVAKIRGVLVKLKWLMNLEHED